MSYIIINILIILLAVSPFIYIFLNGRGKQKIKNDFLKLCKAEGINPDKSEGWAHGAMGYDSKQQVFCYQSQLSGNSFHKVELREIRGVDVRKDYVPHSGENPDLSFLKSVSLCLKTVDSKEIIVPIFDGGFDKQASSEIMIGNEWQNWLLKAIEAK